MDDLCIRLSVCRPEEGAIAGEGGGLTDGQMDGRMDGWMDGRMDQWTNHPYVVGAIGDRPLVGPMPHLRPTIFTPLPRWGIGYR